MTYDNRHQQTISKDQFLVDDQRLTMITKLCNNYHGDIRNTKLVYGAPISMVL